MQNAYTGQTAAPSPLDFVAPDIAVQQRQLQRQQQLAELLRAQALQPTGGTEMVGGWAIPNSPAKPLEKLAQALLARHVQGQADEQETSLAQSRSQALAQALGGLGGGSVDPQQYMTALALDPSGTLAKRMFPEKKYVPVSTNTGGAVRQQVFDPTTGQMVDIGTLEVTAKPDTVLTTDTQKDIAGKRIESAEKIAGNSNATSMATAGISANTSRLNNADSISAMLDAAEMRVKAQERMNSPELKAEVATAVSQAEAKAKKESGGSGAIALIDEADGLLQGFDRSKPTGRPGQYEAVPKPTGSGAGAAVDWAASMVGASPGSAETADRLEVIGGALSLKTPRMEGPQSDADRVLYVQMVGNVGNRRIPIERRREALKTVRQLMNKYDSGGQAPAASGGGWSIAPVGQ